MASIPHFGPFQRIVNVHWAPKGRMATLFFAETWQNGVHNEGDATMVTGPYTANFRIWDNVDIKDAGRQVILAKPHYSNHSQVGDPPQHIVTNYYHFIVTNPSSFGQGWVKVDDVTVNGVTTSRWAEVSDPPDFIGTGISGDGNLDDFRDFLFAQGWTTFTTDDHEGPIESDNPGNLRVFDLDNSVIVFDLDRMLALSPSGTNELTFTMTVPPGPDPVHDPDNIGIIGYQWEAFFDTFQPASFGSFPVTDQTLPGDWPPARSFGMKTSTAVQPTPGATFRFRVRMSDLHVTVETL